MGKLLDFIGLPSPAVLIGVLLALAGAALGGFAFGERTGRDGIKADLYESQKFALDGYRADVKAANERALAEATARAAAAAQNDALKTSLTSALRNLRDAKNKPAPSCIPADWRVRVNAAVIAANAPLGKNDTGIVPIRMPTPAVANGVGLKPVGVGPVGDGGGVHSTP